MGLQHGTCTASCMHITLLTAADDARGVGEPLNETACGCLACDCPGLVARGRHWLVLAPREEAAKPRRTLQQELNDPPLLAFSAIPREVGRYAASTEAAARPPKGVLAAAAAVPEATVAAVAAVAAVQLCSSCRAQPAELFEVCLRCALAAGHPGRAGSKDTFPNDCCAVLWSFAAAALTQTVGASG